METVQLVMLALHLAKLLLSNTRKEIFFLLVFCHSHRNPPCLLSWFEYHTLQDRGPWKIGFLFSKLFDMIFTYSWLLKLLELLVIEASRSFSGKNIFPIFLFRFLTSLVGLVVYMTPCSFVCCPRQEFFSFVTASWI